MESSVIPQFFLSLALMLPQLLIVIVCIYYISKKPALDSTLMTIGSFISLILSAFNSVLIPMFWSYDSGSFETRLMVIRLSSFISFAAWTMFGVGLLLLIRKQILK